MSRELLMLVDALAREKNVEKDIVFAALELDLFSKIARGATTLTSASRISCFMASMPAVPICPTSTSPG